jgi:hypothetical protein
MQQIKNIPITSVRAIEPTSLKNGLKEFDHVGNNQDHSYNDGAPQGYKTNSLHDE